MAEDGDDEPGGCTKACYAILDVLACIVRTIVAIVVAIYRCIQRTVYPIKEAIITCYDTIDHRVNPYKKKVPYTHVPAFQYG